MAGLTGIVAYRAKKGKTRKLHSLIRKHPPLLRSLVGLPDASFFMKSVDGTIIEVYELKYMATKRKAMEAEEFWKLWGEIEEYGTKVKLSSVLEEREIISNFMSI
jgi:hypothetical protein